MNFSTSTIPVNDSVRLETWFVPVTNPTATVVLFHGYASSKVDMLQEAVAFHELQYNIWLVDFRGSGGSSERYTTIGYHEADDVAAVVRHVQASSRDVPLVLYGRSMGGAAVLRAIDACGVNPDGVILESVFDRMSTTAENRFRLIGLPTFPGANLLIYWGGVCAGFDGYRHNPVDYATSCRCPTLLLHGELDPNAQVREATNVQHRLGDRACELVVFPKTGHSPTLAADAIRWHDAIERFAKRVLRP